MRVLLIFKTGNKCRYKKTLLDLSNHCGRLNTNSRRLMVVYDQNKK